MERRHPSSVFSGLSTGRSCHAMTNPESLPLEVWVSVCSDNWNRVNDLLNAYPTYHCEMTLLKTAVTPLSSTLHKESVLRAFKTLLENCTNHSRERNVVMHVARTVVQSGRLEQLRELLTTDIPAMWRDLWNDADNLRTLRGLLVHSVCIKTPEENGLWAGTPQVEGDHSACLTLACQMGVFAASLDAAESESSNFGRLGSPLYKAVYYNRPDLVRFLNEVGAVSRREILQLISLAEENAIKGITMTLIQKVEAIANELALSVQTTQNSFDDLSDFEMVSTAWDVHDLLKTNHYQSLTEIEGFIDLGRLRLLSSHMAMMEASVWYHRKYRMPGTNEYRAAAREIADFLKSHASQPRSLQNLCLLALSREAGMGPDRLTKINKLGLPGSFQRALNFEDPGLKAQKGQ